MRKLITMVMLLVSPYVFATDEIYTGFFSSKALDGYDTVAYFTSGKPVEGSKKFSTEYKGADWYFSSEKNLTLFVNNPEKYAPQYGGYCAWAVSAKVILHPETRINGQLLITSFTSTTTKRLNSVGNKTEHNIFKKPTPFGRN